MRHLAVTYEEFPRGANSMIRDARVAVAAAASFAQAGWRAPSQMMLLTVPASSGKNRGQPSGR
jgi:hypothetical protein